MPAKNPLTDIFLICLRQEAFKEGVLLLPDALADFKYRASKQGKLLNMILNTSNDFGST